MATVAASECPTGGWGAEPPGLVPITIFCGREPNSSEVDEAGPDSLRQSKRMGWRIAAALRHFADTEAEARTMNRCAVIWQGGETAGGPSVVEAARFCEHRLCPTCRGRRAREWSERLRPVYAATEFRLDENGLLERSPEALDAAESRFEHQVAMDEAMGRPERSAARARRMAARRWAEPVKLYPLFVTLTVPNIPHLVEWNPETGMQSVPTDQERTLAGQVEALAEDDPLRKIIAAKLERVRRKNRGRTYLDAVLWEPFRRFRETARRKPDSDAGRWWSLIAGGLWTLEVTYNRQAQTFHPHLHMVVWARVPFLHPEGLRKLWAHYAPGAEVVDIRPVTPGLARDAVKDVGDVQRAGPVGAEHLVEYMLGGMAKKMEEGPDGAKDFRERRYPRGFWHEVALATANRRLINTFGFLRELDGAAVVAEAAEATAAEPGDETGHVDVVTEGRHVLRAWDWRAKTYRVLAAWPASAADPILPMAARLQEWAKRGRAGDAMDRETAARSWVEFARIMGYDASDSIDSMDQEAG